MSYDPAITVALTAMQAQVASLADQTTISTTLAALDVLQSILGYIAGEPDPEQDPPPPPPPGPDPDDPQRSLWLLQVAALARIRLAGGSQPVDLTFTTVKAGGTIAY